MAISTIPSAGVSADTLTATDIADDAIGTAELANDVVISTSGNITTTGKLSTPSIVQTDAQNLSGTYSTHELIMGKTFTLTGDVTVNENLVLSNMSGVGTDITIQPDSTARTITSTGGTGILETGEMLGINRSPAILSGVLPSAVTGGGGLTDGSSLTSLGTVASGNLSNTAIVYPDGHLISISTDVYTGGNFNVDSAVFTIISPSVQHTLVATNTYIVKWYGHYISRLESGSNIGRRAYVEYYMGTTARVQTDESSASGGFGTKITERSFGRLSVTGNEALDGAHVSTDSAVVIVPYGTSGVKYFHIAMCADSASHRATVYAQSTDQLICVIETYKGDIT